MKRTKLPLSAPLSIGSVPPPSTWYEIPRCFACDDPIRSHRFSTSLLLGHTQYSHSSIPGKLGEYIGDGFVVIVTSEDALCRSCMNLLNTMDRLQEELKEHRNKLVGNLRRKYGLDPVENPVPAKPSKKQTPVYDDDVVEIQSDEEWTPYNNKKRKVTPANSSRSKILTCNVCKMEFIDLNRFMTHVKQHKELQEKAATVKEVIIEDEIPKSFKCGCCSLSFDKKETLAAHMRLHTGEKQLIRPTGSSSPGENISLLKNNFPVNSNNGTKLFPKPTSQTVVEMKLIMDAGNKGSSTAPLKINQSLEKPVTVTKVTEKDTGGKVCLLALWNSGSCTDHVDCQNPACGSESSASGSLVHDQQTLQGEMFVPRITVKQSGVADTVSQPEVIASKVSQPQIQVTVGQQGNLSTLPSTSQANTHVVTIPHSVNVRGSSQPVSQIVISVPNQTSANYNPASLQTSSSIKENQSAHNEVILNTSDNVLPQPIAVTGQIADKDKPNYTLSIGNTSEQSSSNFQSEISTITLDDELNTAVSNSTSGSMKGNKSMPSLDDDVIEQVTTEHTIVEQDQMSNLVVQNADGSESMYNPKDETDWFLASEQSNAVLEPPHTLWGNQDNRSSGIATIDQVDGMRPTSTLPFEVREQNDSVDEDEKSEYFTSRYVVDAEKMRQEAEALADAIFAAIKS